MEQKNVSRRGFLVGAGATGILTAVGALSACSPQSSEGAKSSKKDAETTDWRGSEPTIANGDITETLTTEVLVVGSGTSGLFAAASSGEKGAKTLVIEKFDKGGGVRVGFGALGSKLQKESGIELDKHAVVREMTHYASGVCDTRLHYLWAEESGEAVNWWQERCNERDITVWFEPGGQAHDENYWYLQTCHSPRFTENLKGADILTDYCKKHGVEFRYETALVKLIKTGDAVTGAIARTNDNKYIQINASKGVIICTGGYGQNTKMLEALQPNTLKMMSRNSAIPGTEGDGIKACLWAGAAFDDFHTSMLFDRCTVLPDEVGGSSAQGERLWMGSQPFLKVNLEGNRFTSESVPYDFILHAALDQPNRTYCTIWDSHYRENIQRFDMQGCSRLYNFENGAPPVMTMEIIDKANDTLLEKGYIQKADTIEELAKKLNVPVDAFKKSVTRYNELFDKQVDEDFGKEPYRLSELRTPPYYGARQTGYILCTLDGIRIDTNMNAINEKGEAIKGLYVCGNDSGGYYANTYVSHSGGNACGRSGTFARRAGRIAATS